MQPALGRYARELEGTVDSIPTCFGRLAFLAFAWDPGCQRYWCQPAKDNLPIFDLNNVAHSLQAKVFLQWLELSPDQKRHDLVHYFANDLRRIRRVITQITEDGGFAPRGILEGVRACFDRDLLILLEGMLESLLGAAKRGEVRREAPARPVRRSVRRSVRPSRASLELAT